MTLTTEIPSHASMFTSDEFDLMLWALSLAERKQDDYSRSRKFYGEQFAETRRLLRVNRDLFRALRLKVTGIRYQEEK